MWTIVISPSKDELIAYSADVEFTCLHGLMKSHSRLEKVRPGHLLIFSLANIRHGGLSASICPELEHSLSNCGQSLYPLCRSLGQTAFCLSTCV